MEGLSCLDQPAVLSAIPQHTADVLQISALLGGADRIRVGARCQDADAGFCRTDMSDPSQGERDGFNSPAR